MKVTFTIEADVPELKPADTYRVSIKSDDDAYFDAVNAKITTLWPGSASDPSTGPRCDRCGCWVHGHDDYNCGGPALLSAEWAGWYAEQSAHNVALAAEAAQRRAAAAEVIMPDGTVLTCPDIPLDLAENEVCHCGGKVRYWRCRDCGCRAAAPGQVEIDAAAAAEWLEGR
jgi:hypothetical protein